MEMVFIFFENHQDGTHLTNNICHGFIFLKYAHPLPEAFYLIRLQLTRKAYIRVELRMHYINTCISIKMRHGFLHRFSSFYNVVMHSPWVGGCQVPEVTLNVSKQSTVEANRHFSLREQIGDFCIRFPESNLISSPTANAALCFHFISNRNVQFVFPCSLSLSVLPSPQKRFLSVPLLASKHRRGSHSESWKANPCFREFIFCHKLPLMKHHPRIQDYQPAIKGFPK